MEKIEVTPQEKRFLELNRRFVELVGSHYYLRFYQFEIVDGKIKNYQIEKGNLKIEK